MRAADAALQEEAAAAAAAQAKEDSGDSCGAPAPTRRPPLRCSSWALRAAERLLPSAAAHAAAAAYASVAMSQLLRPKAARGRGLCIAATLWLNSLALFAAGCAGGVLLLAQFMGVGVRLLCRANRLMAGALAMPTAECSGPGVASPAWLVAIVCACAAVLVAESRRGGRPGGAALLLRFERRAPRLLLQLCLASFLLAANMLLLVRRRRGLAGWRAGRWQPGSERHLAGRLVAGGGLCSQLLPLRPPSQPNHPPSSVPPHGPHRPSSSMPPPSAPPGSRWRRTVMRPATPRPGCTRRPGRTPDCTASAACRLLS